MTRINREACSYALEIAAGAKRRLTDEYDAAQERGEAAKDGFQSVATVHAKTFPNPLPTAQTGTFCEARPLKVRKTGKG